MRRRTVVGSVLTLLLICTFMDILNAAKISARAELPPPRIDNLIITTADLEAAALRLAQCKNSCGIFSEVLDVEWIYSNYGGEDNQSKIRNCIKDYYNNFQIKYVTIFGDADKVPTRYVYAPDSNDDTNFTATDLYYAALNGTWDDNHDGLYADQRYDDVDAIPDVCIGRIPVSFPQNAQPIVDKIINYQEQFDPSQNWTRRVVLAAGTGNNGIENNLGTGPTVLNDYIANITTDKNIVKLYEEAENLSTDSMRQQINEGALFVDFAGHGDPGSTPIFSAGWLFYWVVTGLIWNGFGISDVRSTTNGARLPVVTTMSCSTARFDDTDCIGEWFVGYPNGGAIAYFGSTRISYSYANNSSPYGLMGEMDRSIYENFYKGSTKLGQMWSQTVKGYVQSKVQNYKQASPFDVKTFMEFILLGDPSLRIYNGPETLKVPEQYATIQGAINAAYNEDTVLVSSGTYYENVVVNKTVNLIGENPETVIIDGSGAGDVVNVTADNVTVMDFKIRNGGVGVVLNLVQNCNVTGNNLADNSYCGVDLVCTYWINNSGWPWVYRPCLNDSIVGNNITNSGQAILLEYEQTGWQVSYNNSICGNNIVNCSGGIFLAGSGNNILAKNSVVGDIDILAGSGNLISENNVKGGINLLADYRHLSFFGGSNNTISRNYVTDSSYGISVNLSSNICIVENNITGTLGGIWLSGSDGNCISRNNIVANNGFGIAFDWRYSESIPGAFPTSSDDNNVSDNNIIGNLVGVWLNSSSNNKIFHNNFMQNSNQTRVDSSSLNNTWDNGYPSAGNYWSNYSGTDLYSGPYKNQTGSDGIGDTPYVIDANNTDNYPLMNPWSPPDIAVTNLTSAKTVIGQRYTGSINVTFNNLGNKIEAFNATVYANSTCIHSEQTMLAMTNCTLSFAWNTTGFAYGNYTISAYAEPVSGETNIADNNCTGGWIVVAGVGDLTGGTANAYDFVPDGRVDIVDVAVVAKFFSERAPPAPANCDVSGPTIGLPDGKIDITDVATVAKHYGEHYSYS